MMTTGAAATRRLSLNLGTSVVEEFKQLAQERNNTLAQTLRLALGLGRAAMAESRKGNRVLVVSHDGTALKELVLPQS